MDDAVLTFLEKLIASSPVVVLVLLGALVAVSQHFAQRERRFEERDERRTEKMEALVRETLQALQNNTLAMHDLRRAIEDRR